MSETWERVYRSRQGIRWWPAEPVVRFAATRLAKRQRILEIGCGTGANLVYFVAESYEAFGSDCSAEALALAKWNLSDFDDFGGATLRQATLPDLGFPGPFDAILDVQCMQHIVDINARRETFANVARALRPGGLFFSMHLASMTGMEVYRRKFPAAGDVSLGDPAAEISEAGMEIVNMEFLTRMYGDRDVVAHWIVEARKV